MRDNNVDLLIILVGARYLICRANGREYIASDWL